ncbi:phage tail assembly chaperone [Rhodobacter sp. SGA-6-6]|uniref:rcc01693 family protein n=1 Tax=Rhodobacter sp. SGA-6-6 TaxID=2710882 RepID=UPI0013EB0813|nr:phage tail assembly chaperone [Rhodobacter sp. SGA-6-6]
MRPAIDWPGLIRAGLRELRLEPAAFWRLTPVELRMMLGAEQAAPPLTRARLAELAAAFPDMEKGKGDGDDRGFAGSAGGA